MQPRCTYKILGTATSPEEKLQMAKRVNRLLSEHRDDKSKKDPSRTPRKIAVHEYAHAMKVPEGRETTFLIGIDPRKQTWVSTGVMFDEEGLTPEQLYDISLADARIGPQGFIKGIVGSSDLENARRSASKIPQASLDIINNARFGTFSSEVAERLKIRGK